MRDAQPIILEALGGYFNNLDTAATNKKSVLEDFVANLATLTTSNAEMADTVKNSLEENWQLQQQLNILRKNLMHDDLRAAAQRQLAVGCDKTLCPN